MLNRRVLLVITLIILASFALTRKAPAVQVEALAQASTRPVTYYTKIPPTEYPTQATLTFQPTELPLTHQPTEPPLTPRPSIEADTDIPPTDAVPLQAPISGTQIEENARAIAGLVTKAIAPVDNTLTIVGLILGVLGPILVIYVKGRTDAQLAVLKAQYDALKEQLDSARTKITGLEADNKKLEDARFQNLEDSQDKMATAVAAGVSMATAPYDKRIEEQNTLIAGQNSKITGLEETVKGLEARVDTLTGERDKAVQELKEKEEK